jgi:hypothetical protein
MVSCLLMTVSGLKLMMFLLLMMALMMALTLLLLYLTLQLPALTAPCFLLFYPQLHWTLLHFVLLHAHYYSPHLLFCCPAALPSPHSLRIYLYWVDLYWMVVWLYCHLGWAASPAVHQTPGQ